jgi:erythromycin esterase-like protein
MTNTSDIQSVPMSLRTGTMPHSFPFVESVMRDSTKALRSPQDLNSLIQKLKDKRVVMLGESSHGTQEFYQMRRLISQKLIDEHGFQILAVEGDWPDAYRLNRYIKTGAGKSAKSVLQKNHRWPTWMWANEETVRLAEWMRGRQAGFYGLDVYSLFDSISEVTRFYEKHHPEIADEISRRYACFEPFEFDEIAYARSLIQDPEGCEQEALLNLQNILGLRLAEIEQDGDELFSAQQNAHIITNAESYYRSMLHGDANSWNVRDGHMMETLDRLLERAGESAKAIVWAHNTHIGDYRATDMKSGGYVNLGGLARQSYGEDNVSLVGFGSFEGEVLAGRAWGAPEQKMTLPPAPLGTYEHHFHQVSMALKANRLYLDLTEHAHGPLAQTRGHRAVGVVYNPEHEARGNYVPTELSRRYDHFVFIDQSTALKSLHVLPVQGEFPETWPNGV